MTGFTFTRRVTRILVQLISNTWIEVTNRQLIVDELSELNYLVM